jgi:hypothetical protein
VDHRSPIMGTIKAQGSADGKQSSYLAGLFRFSSVGREWWSDRLSQIQSDPEGGIPSGSLEVLGG